MTVPGYPVAGTHTAYYGGEVYKLPLLAENGFYPDLDGIPADVRRRAKLLVLNYPNSPTGAWRRATSTAGSSTSRGPIRSSSCRTRPTSC